MNFADYAMLNKIFVTDYAGLGRYSPPKCVGAIKNTIKGNPDPELVNTSFAESRHDDANGNAPLHAIDQCVFKEIGKPLSRAGTLLFWYNWTRQHKTHRLSPAMAAGLTDELLSMTDLAEMVDAAQPKPKKRCPYKMVAAA